MSQVSTTKDFAKKIPALKKRFELGFPKALGLVPEGRLGDAIIYALRTPGKRLRPLLCYAAAEILSLRPEQAAAPAVALELVHTYSLVHDDLPAMDDDDLRRGKPSLHRAFDEATAILAGDALLTLAFKVLAEADAPDRVKVAWVRELAEGAGAQGMVLGQSMDLEAPNLGLDFEGLADMHARKTGRLLRLAMRLLAAWRDDLTDREQKLLSDFGDLLGLAYQVQDDLRDLLVPTEALGKPQGSDQRQGKVTFVTFMGVARAQLFYGEMCEGLDTVLDALPFETGPLEAVAQYALVRRA